jgi:hypothetical protein
VREMPVAVVPTECSWPHPTKPEWLHPSSAKAGIPATSQNQALLCRRSSREFPS